MEYPITIIIPTSEGYKKNYGADCLGSIPDGCEVLVLDFIPQVDKFTDTLNRGIKQAKNEWIIPLGMDDKLYEGILPILMNSIDNSDVYYSPLKFFGRSDNLLTPNKEITLENLSKNNQVYFTSMFRKSKALEIGGYYSPGVQPFYEDWDFWLRMCQAGAKFKYIDTPIFYYRNHENQGYIKMLPDKEKLKSDVLKHCNV